MEAPLEEFGNADIRTPLGEILVARKLITQLQLERALNIQEQDGTRLGDILISEGMIGYYHLYRAVAKSYALPFIDVLENPPDPNLLSAADTDAYLQLRLIPWRATSEDTYIAVSEVTFEIMLWIRQKFGTRTKLVVTSPLDINRTVERIFGSSMEKDSCLSLWKSLPLASARMTMIPRQKILLYILIAACAAFAMIEPIYTALFTIIMCHVAYTITMLFKLTVFTVGAWVRKPIDLPDNIPPHDLPIYSVLVPMYREADSLPGMLRSMRQMDYPASKLDIKLVLEADDDETMDAAYALKPHYQFDIIRVPAGELRTKPKACNYALRFARGEFITIFDADDRPEPAQLKKAVHAFRTLPGDVVCLQARLNYYNAQTNWLTRSFALEYSILFQVTLYGLERLGIPIPLGGTSNHIALQRLKDLGEWDPYNVTEDADLGTRLAARGLRTAMIDSYTMEEAPIRPRAWVNQRSRWIKGYMQTWLVHMRDPKKLYRTLGWKSFIGFQCFIGLSTFTFLSAPLVWILSLLWIGSIAHWHDIPFPGWLGALTITNLCLNMINHWYFTLYCARRFHNTSYAMTWAALSFPLYLVLHSLASYKALWQLILKPHFWEKTTHGLCQTPAFDSHNLMMHNKSPAFS